MTWELICDNCGRVIPSELNYIRTEKHVFCNNECEFKYYDFIEYLESAGYPGDY